MPVQRAANHLYNLDVRDTFADIPPESAINGNLRQILTETAQLYVRRGPVRCKVVILSYSPRSLDRASSSIVSSSEESEDSAKGESDDTAYRVSSSQDDTGIVEDSRDSSPCHKSRSFRSHTGTSNVAKVHDDLGLDETESCRAARNPARLKLATDTKESGRDAKCSVCGIRFRYRVHLIRHQRTVHAGERPYACCLCSKTFTRKEHVDRHMLHHSGQRPHLCRLCSRSFSSSSNLHTHMRLHDAKQRSLFECAFCKRRFSNKYNRDDHERTHTGERPFSCNSCKKRYASKSSLNSHYKRGCS
ncbi:zinc finger protein-like [Tropilaelaps mercedesae]|uniref:Zinc finger protein-like n=1 Tax=Tropilaelaps mercedesae TaxID=418985 RepID=A0A1V9XI42_9ACAR|nr:zinc finger protein-like [Tropilaelaps mercedesae]